MASTFESAVTLIIPTHPGMIETLHVKVCSLAVPNVQFRVTAGHEPDICFDCEAERKARISRMTIVDPDDAVNIAAQQIPVTTSGEFRQEGHIIAESMSLVTARCVIGVGLLSELSASLKDLFGGRSKTMQDAIAAVESALIEDLRERALAVGADAVIETRFQFGEISGKAHSCFGVRRRARRCDSFRTTERGSSLF